MKKLTLQAIAEAAGVSCATVSRCLSGKDGVGEDTRIRVLQLCRQMGYNTNFMESAPHRTGRIGLLLPSLAESVSGRLAQELEQHLSSLGYSLVVAQSLGNRQQEQEALQRLAAQHVDGVIVIPVSRESRKLFRTQQPPVEGIFLCANMGDQPESYVAVDHFLGGQAAVRYLHGLGHRKILYVGNEESEVSNKRRSGVVSAFRQLQLEGLCVDAGQLQDMDPGQFTAIIAGDCTIALRCPADKMLVSFDGETMAQAGILLTTFDSPANMAAIAADILLEKLDRPVGGYSHRMVVPQLQKRGSEVKHLG